MNPLSFLLSWVFGALTAALLGISGYIGYNWYSSEYVSDLERAFAILVLMWSLAGRWFVLAFYPAGSDDPHELSDDSVRFRSRDGSDIRCFDEAGTGTTIILTHGWGLDSSAWYYVRKRLGRRYRLVSWDLPGLGGSSQPSDGAYTVQRLAENLREIISRSGGRVVLVGHSIGGMMIETLFRTSPEIARSVDAVVLANTTYTKPLRTIIASPIMQALERPLIVPLLHLTRLVWPLAWSLNLLSYWNGSAHITNRITSLSRAVTRGQLEFATRFNVKANPAVIAKGLLATLSWDESEHLTRITVPALVIVADADRITLPQAGEHIAQTIPHAAVRTIAPAGHNGILEEGDEYAAAIAAFVDQRRAAPISKSAS